MGPDKPKTGLHKRIFGSILFFLGALQVFFLFKAGAAIPLFQILITFAGAALFVYGTLEDWAGSDN